MYAPSHTVALCNHIRNSLNQYSIENYVTFVIVPNASTCTVADHRVLATTLYNYIVIIL